MSTSGPDSGRDDLGRALLAQHPRGEQWRQLDVTIANLTFEQITRMGSLAEERAAERQAVRDRIIARISDHELAGRLASRWIRWKDTFGLPMPAELDDPIIVLHHPYLLAQQAPPEHSGWHNTVLPVFDAGLAIAAAGSDQTGITDYELLTAPWRQTCLPSRFTATDAYGPHTQAALRVLRHAEAIPTGVVRRMGHVCAESTSNAGKRHITRSPTHRSHGDSRFVPALCIGRPFQPPRTLSVSPPPIRRSSTHCGARRRHKRSPDDSTPTPACC